MSLMTEMPTYLEMMYPTLQAVGLLGGSGDFQQINDKTIDVMGIPGDVVAISYDVESSQSGSKVHHRLAWARTYLKRIGALSNPRRRVWALTDAGRVLLDMDPELAKETIRNEELEARRGKEPKPEFFQEAKSGAADGTPSQLTVRQLIKHWGASRRGAALIERIRSALADHGLKTEPDFASVWVDETVSIVNAVPQEIEGPSAVERLPPVTLTVSSLASANSDVAWINPSGELITAQSIMMRHDYSQLAVMTGPRDLKGAVSWESIAQERLRNPEAKLADCVIKPHVVSTDDPLIQVVGLVIDHGYVFVRAHDGKVGGIVTMADLSEQFVSLAEPFIQLGEIERWLRRGIDREFDPDELAELLDPDDVDREVESAGSLTLGELERLLEEPGSWARLGWPADRKEFVGALSEIRTIRNEVMHFSPDPLIDDDLKALRNMVKWVRSLADV